MLTVPKFVTGLFGRSPVQEEAQEKVVTFTKIEPKVARTITPAQHFAAHFKIGLQLNINRCQRLLNQHYEHEKTRVLTKEESASKEILIEKIKAKESLTRAHKKCAECWDVRLIKEYEKLEKSPLIYKLEAIHDKGEDKYYLRMTIRSNLYDDTKSKLDNSYQAIWLYGSPTVEILPLGRTSRPYVKNGRATKSVYLCEYATLFTTLSLSSAILCALRTIYEKY